MKYINTREREYNNKNKRDAIYHNLRNSYDRIVNKESIDLIIRDHKRLINSLDIKGKPKNKFKTLILLEVYKNTKDKAHALICFSNYLNNLKLLY